MPITRGEIEADIAQWLNRSDISGPISTMFAIAHKAIQRRKTWLCMQGVAPIALIADQDAYPITTGPSAIADFKAPESLGLFDTSATINKVVKFFDKKSIQEIRFRRIQGDPLLVDVENILKPEAYMYAIWAGNIEIWPKLNAAAIANKQLNFDYWKYLDPPADGGADFFTNNCRDYLLYRALVESPGFLGADSRFKLWTSYMTNAYNEITGDETGRDIQGDELVMRG